MSDNDLSPEWSALEPTSRQRQRIEDAVSRGLDARETSLLAEWLGFLRVSPIAGLGFVAAGVVSLALVTPLSWLSVLVVP